MANMSSCKLNIMHINLAIFYIPYFADDNINYLRCDGQSIHKTKYGSYK